MKNKASVTANIIHSLDALQIRIVINRLEIPLLPLHDAYLISVYNSRTVLKNVVNETFLKIHTGFRNEILNKSFKIEIPKTTLLTQTFNLLG